MPSGSFCERHGPYNTPNNVCPYCEMEGSVEGQPPSNAQPDPSEHPTQLGINQPVGLSDVAAPPPQSPIAFEDAPTQLPGGLKPPKDDPPPVQPPASPPTPPASDEPLDGYGYGANQDIDILDSDTMVETSPESAPVSSSPSMGPLAFLLVQTPLVSRGQVITLLPGNVIGRQKADVIIPDRKISRQHARINLEPPEESGEVKFAIFDFGTANGTHVNDNEISGRQVLEENDEIRMGGHTFIFKTLT